MNRVTLQEKSNISPVHGSLSTERQVILAATTCQNDRKTTVSTDASGRQMTPQTESRRYTVYYRESKSTRQMYVVFHQFKFSYFTDEPDIFCILPTTSLPLPSPPRPRLRTHHMDLLY